MLMRHRKDAMAGQQEIGRAMENGKWETDLAACMLIKEKKYKSAA